LLRRTAATAPASAAHCTLRHVLLDRTLIHHDGKTEPRMGFSSGYERSGRLVDGAAGSVPINDDAVNPRGQSCPESASSPGPDRQSCNQRSYDWRRRTIALSGRELWCSPRIKKRVHVEFADIAFTQIAIGLSGKAVGCAGVIRRLRRKRRGRFDLEVCGKCRTGHDRGRRDCNEYRERKT